MENKSKQNKHHEQQQAKPKEVCRVLYAAAEAMPFLATGGLGEVAGSLPASINADPAFDVRVILPLYGQISEEHRKKMTFIGSRYIRLAWRNQYCGLYQLEHENVTYYFIDNEYYFKRSEIGPYGYYDDGERYAFFSRAVMECLSDLSFEPELIHANDWQTALIPIYLATARHDKHIKTVYTIHNMEYQGRYPMNILGDVFDLSPSQQPIVEFNGAINLTKGAIECADVVTTVSPTYAKELQYDFYANDLASVVAANRHKMVGILNGIDTNRYNPQTDKDIFAKFSKEDPTSKTINKTELQNMVNLPKKRDVPLIAVISRLVEHKGIDLVSAIADEVLKSDVQLVVLGKGERGYEDRFRMIGRRYPAKATALICYNHDLARKVYAGADLFLMPSKMEPCGLAQMIACRYGAVPIVRQTGGLNDSIGDLKAEKDRGRGFLFYEYTAQKLKETVDRALLHYQDKTAWLETVRHNMQVDFSWSRSAQSYKKMYTDSVK